MITVVIPAFNEERNIASTLESLIVQKTKQKVEIILVDNSSTDKTVKIAQKYKKMINLVIVNEKIKGRGSARAAGFSRAKGEIVLSTDADTRVPPNWIERMAAELKADKKFGAVTGTCRFDDLSPLTNFSLNMFQPTAMYLFRIVFGHYWLSGFNFGIYREVYRKTGGFIQKLNVQEDIDLSFKVAKIAHIKFIADLPVTASGRRFKNGIWKGMMPYVSTFIEYFWQKNDRVILDDQR